MLQALHCLPWWSTRANTTTLGEHIAPELSWSEAPRKDTSTNSCLQNMESGSFYHLHAADQLDKLNLILMDSHYSHVFNYCYMKMMFDKDIKVMALEAHSSHYSQPLDKNPFSAFKNEFNFQMKRFNRTVGGTAITKAEFILSCVQHCLEQGHDSSKHKGRVQVNWHLAPRHRRYTRWVVCCL